MIGVGDNARGQAATPERRRDPLNRRPSLDCAGDGGLIAGKGPAIMNSDPRDLFSLQEDVLSESLNFDYSTEIEKDILSLLSWCRSSRAIC